ncbi:MAG TPA: TonB family protein [Kofleriaceae bacterium]|nr:TonB family protein [Kofleriaceae bacterium]
MNDWWKLAICAVASLVLHFALERGLEQLPRYTVVVKPQKLKVTVVTPPPPPEPEPPKPPDEPKPLPKAEVHEAPRPHARVAVEAVQPKSAPEPEHPAVVADEGEPVFGTTMESTSSAGTGPAVPIGNTARPEAGSGSAVPVKHAPEPVQAFEATKMPLPQGHCYGKYNDDALKAGIEGTVVLDLIVGADGRVRDVVVVKGIGHGLDEAALAALHDCRFSPGEKDGKPVAVRIRGFKITFVLPDQ